MRRVSTLTFGRRAAAQMEGGQKMAEALALPMVPDILETMDAHEGATFFVLGAVQIFKSLCGQLRMLRNHVVRPAPAGWYAPTKDFAKDFARRKLNPLRETIAEIKLIQIAQKAQTQILSSKFVGGGNHTLFSANTENDRTGKTLRDIYEDEVHLYETGWLEQMSNRRADFPNDFTETLMSTGLTKGTDGELAWNRTDQRVWHVRCPECRKFYEPRYLHRERSDDPESPIVGGIRYEKHFLETGLPNEIAIAANLYHECPKCHAKHADTQASRMLLSGTADKPRGVYVATNANAALRCFGWQVSGLAVRPWLPIVVRFETAQLARARGDIEPLLKFLREELAAVVDPEKFFRPDKFNKYQHCGPELDSEGKRVATPYKMCEEWAGALKDAAGKPIGRLAKIDMQQDWFRLVIREWGRFSQSRLYLAATCLSPSEIALHLTAAGVPPEHVVMDSRFDKQRARTTCSRMGWRTMMGDRQMRDYTHKDGLKRIFDEPKFIDAWTGTVHQGQPSGGFVIETLFSKNAALDRLALLRNTDSKAPDGTPLWTAASDAPDWYYKETNAHYRKRIEDSNAGFHFEWHGSAQDHADDCEAMGVVVAAALGWTGAESISTEKPKL